MAIRNKVAVYINGINLTPFVVLPLKWGNLLDEQLDEMYLSLRRCPIKNFKPLTPVEIRLTNELYWHKETVNTKSETKRYLIANDTNAINNPIGSKLYDHDLYLIELTKIAECIVVDTLTFTNDLGRIYASNRKIVSPNIEIITEVSNNTVYYNDLFFNPFTPSTYQSPLLFQEMFIFESPEVIFSKFWSQWKSYSYFEGSSPLYVPYGRITIKRNGVRIYESYKGFGYGTHVWEQSGDFKGLSLQLLTGTYTVEYRCELSSYKVATSVAGPTYTLEGFKYSLVTYNFVVVENLLPLKKWTMKAVINRVLDVAEPIRFGEKPRFKLNEEQAEKFDKILAPQFSFTKQTLRECLQECGKIVHGEPRLDIQRDSNGKYYYEVSFDLYGQTEKSKIFHKKYVTKTVSQVINTYASHLDSNAENLVNQLDKYQGVIIEPYREGKKSVRTETMYARITDSNMIISTQYPIYSVEKLECCYIPRFSSDKIPVNITPWLFESSVYNSQLSSYLNEYPYSKAYGIYYTQGEKNIKGLNFKIENPIHSVFENYAIINILRAATENNSITLDEYKYDSASQSGTVNSEYPLLEFRVTYTPFYNARVGQTKSYYPEYPYGAALIFNQQANVIESRYYGENLKGAIARIGNVEKSITFILARLWEIPKAGQMYDDDYYISAVSVEFLPTYIKCTIGLSKDFNRLSQYIGISSVKRFSEVSQTQALERNTLYKEYVVIGDELEPDRDSLIGEKMMSGIAETFLQNSNVKSLTNVAAWGVTYKKIDLAPICLPIISSAFGNSLSFSWRYEDNYSAGPIAEYALNGDVQGYFQNNYKYTDEYGRIYYYHFDLQESGVSTKSGLSFPKGNIPTQSSKYLSTIENEPYILRKGSRDTIQVNVQIDFVTNLSNLIIGSALAAYCPLVRGTDSSLKAKLYVFNEPLNKFINHVQGSINVDLSTLPSTDITVTMGDGKFSVNAGAFPANGKAWAIVTEQTETDAVKVEDEQGEIYEQKEVKGGDVLIAQNIEVSEGQAFTPIYFTKKRKIFDDSVWIDVR